MSPRVRLLRHPGPVDPVRLESAVEAGGRAVRLTLAAGATLHDAIARPLTEQGLASATFTLFGGGLRRARYVLARQDPTRVRLVALTPPEEAADVSLVLANGTLGLGADGQPFIHCHALFAGRDGRAFGGHVLTEETVVGDGVRGHVRAFGEVSVEVRFDPEINVGIFRPGPGAGTPRAAGEPRP